MDIKIMIVSFISYVLGALINEHIFHREKKVKRVVFQYQIDRKFFFVFPTILVVTKTPSYLKGYKKSIEFYFLRLHIRWLIQERESWYGR